MNNHLAICEWLQLDPENYAFTPIEPLGNNCFRVSFLDGSVSDWRFTYEDGVLVDGYCYNDVI